MAIVALSISIASVVWQMATFALTGPRVKVELLVGAFDGSTAVHQVAGRFLDWDRWASQGYTTPIVGVTVRNRGRMPVSVTGWSFSLESGPTVAPIGLGPLNPGKTLPHRLEGGSSETWLLSADEIGSAARAWRGIGKDCGSLYAKVDLGTGRTIRSKNTTGV